MLLVQPGAHLPFVGAATPAGMDRHDARYSELLLNSCSAMLCPNVVPPWCSVAYDSVIKRCTSFRSKKTLKVSKIA